jgi:hypothetical protein
MILANCFLIIVLFSFVLCSLPFGASEPRQDGGLWALSLWQWLAERRH